MLLLTPCVRSSSTHHNPLRCTNHHRAQHAVTYYRCLPFPHVTKPREGGGDDDGDAADDAADDDDDDDDAADDDDDDDGRRRRTTMTTTSKNAPPQRSLIAHDECQRTTYS